MHTFLAMREPLVHRDSVTMFNRLLSEGADLLTRDIRGGTLFHALFEHSFEWEWAQPLFGHLVSHGVQLDAQRTSVRAADRPTGPLEITSFQMMSHGTLARVTGLPTDAMRCAAHPGREDGVPPCVLSQEKQPHRRAPESL